jgi:hypothetical protein
MSSIEKGPNDSLYRRLGLSILEPATTLHGMTTTLQPAHATSMRRSGVWEQQLEHQQQGSRYDTSRAPGMFSIYFSFVIFFSMLVIVHWLETRGSQISGNVFFFFLLFFF